MKTKFPEVKVLLLESKLGFLSLAHKFGFTVIRLRDLRINLLRPPRGVPHHIWVSLLAQNMMNYLDIMVASSSLLLDVCMDLYRQRGVVNRWDRPHPTLDDLIEALEDLKCPAIAHTARYKETLLNRLKGLRESFPGLFSCDPGMDVAVLLQHDVLILMEDMPNVTLLNFLKMTIFSQSFVYVMIVAGPQSRLTNIVVLDEAASVLRRMDEIRDKPHFITTVISQVASFGLGLIFTSQFTTDLAHVVMANATTKILVGGFERGDDGRTFLDSRPHTPEQADVVKSHREPGHAFISDLRSPHFVEVVIEQPDLPPAMTREEVDHQSREAARAFGWDAGASRNERSAADRTASATPAAPASPQRGVEMPQAEPAAEEHREESPTPMPDRDMMILADLEQTPFQTFKVRTGRLRLAREPLQDAIKRLEAKHFIVIHKAHLRAGAPSDLYEVTEEGYRVLRKEMPERRGHGSYLHQFYQRAIAAHWKKRGYEVCIEGRADEKAVDIIAIQRPEGEVIAVEIELHVQTSAHFIHNLLQALRAPRVTRVICLVPTMDELKVVEKGIKENAELAASRERTTVDCIRNYMEIKK